MSWCGDSSMVIKSSCGLLFFDGPGEKELGRPPPGTAVHPLLLQSLGVAEQKEGK